MNILLLLKHTAGNNTLCESVYFGVPQLIIPLYFDQVYIFHDFFKKFEYY